MVLRVTTRLLPRDLQEVVHHDHATASHRGVTKTLGAHKDRYYWPGLASQVKRWVRTCHECGAKKNWGRKRRSSPKQYMVAAPMERLAMYLLGPLSLTPRGNRFVLVVTDFLQSGLRVSPSQIKKLLQWLRSWWVNLCVDLEFLVSCTVIT